jgi:formamidopyrimidine-DNA glycosylase
VDHVLLRRPDLRWPIPREVENLLPGQRIDAIRRRAKYLLLDTEAGSALLHLGMSGSLRVLPATRRCGRTTMSTSPSLCGWNARPRAALQRPAPLRLPAVASPGTVHRTAARISAPSRCRTTSTAMYLFARSRGRSAPVKSFLMDQAVVVGVGNIYAAEACSWPASRRCAPPARSRANATRRWPMR